MAVVKTLKKHLKMLYNYYQLPTYRRQIDQKTNTIYYIMYIKRKQLIIYNYGCIKGVKSGTYTNLCTDEEFLI